MSLLLEEANKTILALQERIQKLEHAGDRAVGEIVALSELLSEANTRIKELEEDMESVDTIPPMPENWSPNKETGL